MKRSTIDRIVDAGVSLVMLAITWALAALVLWVEFVWLERTR